jgi:NAD(P)-dependent dehydrogenase (short-subunit alcohol dehydrogenase family)
MNQSDRQIAVVTGATGGIGRWIALGLARAGHHVILISRDAQRGRAAAVWIAQQAPGSSTEVRLADLGSLAATRRLGQEIVAAYPRIGVLVNNAGIFTARRQVTAEGHEMVLAVNHLAPYLLTYTLEDALRAGAPSRVINVGSSTSERASIYPDNLELARRWGMLRSYSQSKLAIMMSTFALAQRLQGTGVVANVVHPGAVATGLIREGGAIGLAWRLMAPFMRTEEQGADTPLHAALAPEWATITGAYVKDRAVARPNRRALDPVLVEKVDAATRMLALNGLEGTRKN